MTFPVLAIGWGPGVKAFTQPNLIDCTSDKEGTFALDHLVTSMEQALSRENSTSTFTDKQVWAALKSPTANSGEYNLLVFALP